MAYPQEKDIECSWILFSIAQWWTHHFRPQAARSLLTQAHIDVPPTVPYRITKYIEQNSIYFLLVFFITYIH